MGPLAVTGGSNIEATNALIGCQVGLEFNVPLSQSVYISSVGKFGGYYNPTKVVTTTFDSINGAETVEDSKDTGSFLAEVGGRLNVELIPGCLTAFVGYDAMWIDGIALAPPQFLTTAPTAGIDTTNTPFFQSITVGGQLSY
jgi:hypothetical protein